MSFGNPGTQINNKLTEIISFDDDSIKSQEGVTLADGIFRRGQGDEQECAGQDHPDHELASAQ